MEFIIVDVYDECIDDFSSENFKTKCTHRFGQVYITDIYDPSKEYDLGTTILQKKGDGMIIKVNSTDNIHFIEVFLLYGELDSSSDDELISSIKKWLDTTFEAVGEEVKPLFNTVVNYEDGFFLKIEDVWNSDFLAPLIENLATQGIRCEVVNHTKTQHEWGAGNYIEQILLFISGAISSGITWDLIKGRLSKLSDQFGELTDTKQFQGFNIQKIISKVAEEVGENINNLQLTDMEVAEELYSITLKTRYREIKVRCDNNYQIKNCIIKDLTQTRI